MEASKALLITLPKSISWKSYEKELAAVRDGSQQMNFRVANYPRKVDIGSRCYICHDGFIKGWMKIVAIGRMDEFDCTTTGEKYESGFYVSRSGEFHYLKEPVPCRGFQGFRYIDNI